MNDTITLPRKTLQSALDAHRALRNWVKAVPEDTPLPAMPGCDGDWLDVVEARLKNALAAPQPVQEPVAQYRGTFLTPQGTREFFGVLLPGKEIEPSALLYANPVAQPVQEPVALSEVWLVGSKTFMMLFATKDAANTFCSHQPPSAGLWPERISVIGSPPTQPVQSPLRGVDAGPISEWIDLVSRGYVQKDEMLIRASDAARVVAQSEPKAMDGAQPVQSPSPVTLTDEWLSELFYANASKTGFTTKETYTNFARAIEAALKGKP